MDIPSSRLVILSACEAEITDIMKSIANEFIGSLASFMFVGVR
jgi:hypothetical protein